MKRLISLLLAAAMLFTLTGCKKKRIYEPVESTKEEAQTVITLKFDNKTYNVRYELYRALFLTYKSEIDGGDASVWSGPNAANYIDRIQETIIARAVDIYSTIALAESLGLKPYSTEVEKQINEYINMSVDGGTIKGEAYPGYESYEEYLDALKSLYLNYSIQVLLFRYAIASDMIDEYFMGSLTEDGLESGISENFDGELKYTKDEVRDFYNSDKCVRVLRTFVSDNMHVNPAARASELREAIASIASGGEDAVRKEMIAKGSLAAAPELDSGYIIAEHNLTKSYYSKMVTAAFALEMGEVSDIIPVHDGNSMSYYILYRTEKSSEHFEENYPSITYIYLRNEIGKKYDSCAKLMIQSAEFTDATASIDHSAITMG